MAFYGILAVAYAILRLNGNASAARQSKRRPAAGWRPRELAGVLAHQTVKHAGEA